MPVATQNFSALVDSQVASIQGTASALVDFSEGSTLRAIVEANGGMGIFLQSLILQVAALTRASTSNGPDLDSFVNDFGLERNEAVGASGQAAFARYTPTAQALIPAGAQVGTADGTQTFTVAVNTSNPNWSAAQNGYILAAGVSSITVPVTASSTGAASNVVAGSISLILQAIPGVDTVTNATATTGGSNEETDAALRLRFQQFILSLASATLAAINYAISGVQSNLQDTISENENLDGSPNPGYLAIVVNDGTGAPPTSTLNAVYTAVDGVRAAGIGFGVFAPTVITAAIAMTLTVAAGYNATTLATQVEAALTAYINSLTLGETLSYTYLLSVAFGVSPGITNITGYTINGGTADLPATGNQVIQPGTVTVTP